MKFRTTKLRWRRSFRKKRRQVEDLGVQAEQHIERNFFRRLGRLGGVRRFVAGWVLLLVLLSGLVVVQGRALGDYYLENKHVAGGTYNEGIIGSFTNANPLYATSPVDSAVSRLLFSGLLKFDDQNQLVGDLADTWSVDEKGVRYTVRLKERLKWHDGKPLTAEDVLFTYHTIQNPDAKSPLLSSWQGIGIEVIDDVTVVFVLPNTLSSFPYSLTNGIVPKHLLGATPATQLRSVRFNTMSPVGAGPFRWETIEVQGDSPEEREERIGLLPNEDYNAGIPKVDHFIIRTFRNEQRMTDSYKRGELQAMAGLDTVPDTLKDVTVAYEQGVPFSGAVMLFFRTTEGVLADQKVRQALVQAVNQAEILKSFGYPVTPVHGPMLNSHFAYDPNITQFAYAPDSANQLLEDNGWKRDESGIRTKDGNQLRFRIHTQSTSEYTFVTQKLQQQFAAIGVIVDVTQQGATELQATLAQHSYDALLYGIALGEDPDVFAYWHSSQADIRSASRLNFSEYRSETADKALEGGRTRTDQQLRLVKYRPFLEAWKVDAPAVAFYQPRFLYVTRGVIDGFRPKQFNSAVDRYANVHNWMIREDRVQK